MPGTTQAVKAAKPAAAKKATPKKVVKKVAAKPAAPKAAPAAAVAKKVRPQGVGCHLHSTACVLITITTIWLAVWQHTCISAASL